MSEWRVTKVGGEHVAECVHDEYVWTIHRSTDYLARRSLDAHLRHEHDRRPTTPPPNLGTTEGEQR